MYVFKEKYRPQFHFSPPSGWMNDPNGLVYYRGEYHLFYQHNPHSLNWDSMHWGHAVSKDMIGWNHLPIAYTPETEIDDYFSGSSVIDEHNVAGFFEAEKKGIVNIFTHRDSGVQQQYIGYSADGRNFTRYLECVLPNPGREDFRDPKVVWLKNKKSYLMVLAVYDHVEFYTSRDLKKWTLYSKFGQLEGTHYGVWECPDLFELPVRGPDESRWVLLVSDQGVSKLQYFIGHFEGKKFVSEISHNIHLQLDGGTDNYATQTFDSMPDGRRVLMGLMVSPHLFNSAPTSPWRSNLTLPRELWLENTDEGIRLFQRPIEEVNSLRGESHSLSAINVDRTFSVADHIAPQFDAEMVINVEESTAIQAGIQFCVGERQEIVVSYDLQRQVLFVNRSLSGDMSYAEHIPPYHEVRLKPRDGKVSLRILLDHSALEVFDINGETAITALVFPDPAQGGIKLFARKGFAVFERLDIYPMRSVWDKE